MPRASMDRSSSVRVSPLSSRASLVVAPARALIRSTDRNRSNDRTITWDDAMSRGDLAVISRGAMRLGDAYRPLSGGQAVVDASGLHTTGGAAPDGDRQQASAAVDMQAS